MVAQKAITQQQSKPVRRYKVGKRLKNQHETVPSDKVSGWLISRNTVASFLPPLYSNSKRKDIKQ